MRKRLQQNPPLCPPSHPPLMRLIPGAVRYSSLRQTWLQLAATIPVPSQHLSHCLHNTLLSERGTVADPDLGSGAFCLLDTGLGSGILEKHPAFSTLQRGQNYLSAPPPPQFPPVNRDGMSGCGRRPHLRSGHALQVRSYLGPPLHVSIYFYTSIGMFLQHELHTQLNFEIMNLIKFNI